MWSKTKAAHHINVLKMEAVLRAIQHWRTSLAGHVVTVSVDNSTTVAYINRHSGTRSAAQLGWVWDLLLLCQSVGIKFLMAHLVTCTLVSI